MILKKLNLPDSHRRISSQDIKISLISITTATLFSTDLFNDSQLLEVLKRPLYRGYRGFYPFDPLYPEAAIGLRRVQHQDSIYLQGSTECLRSGN